MKRSLYDIDKDLFAIVEQIERLGDSGEDEREKDKLYQQLMDFRMEFQQKIGQWAKMKRYNLAMVEALEKEIARLNRSKTSIKNSMERFDNMAIQLMEQHQLTKAGIPGYGLRIATTTSVVPDVGWEETLDPQFKKIDQLVKIKKNDIKAWVKDTGEIPIGVDIRQRKYIALLK